MNIFTHISKVIIFSKQSFGELTPYEIREISPSLSCNLEIVDVDGKDVGVIVVKSGHNKPYVLSGAIYVRNGSNTQKLTTAEEMRDFCRAITEGSEVPVGAKDALNSVLIALAAKESLEKGVPVEVKRG